MGGRQSCLVLLLLSVSQCAKGLECVPLNGALECHCTHQAEMFHFYNAPRGFLKATHATLRDCSSVDFSDFSFESTYMWKTLQLRHIGSLILTVSVPSQLQKLVLEDVTLEEPLSREVFQEAPHLTELVIKHSNIGTIERETFTDVHVSQRVEMINVTFGRLEKRSMMFTMDAGSSSAFIMANCTFNEVMENAIDITDASAVDITGTTFVQPVPLNSFRVRSTDIIKVANTTFHEACYLELTAPNVQILSNTFTELQSGGIKVSNSETVELQRLIIKGNAWPRAQSSFVLDVAWPKNYFQTKNNSIPCEGRPQCDTRTGWFLAVLDHMARHDSSAGFICTLLSTNHCTNGKNLLAAMFSGAPCPDDQRAFETNVKSRCKDHIDTGAGTTYSSASVFTLVLAQLAVSRC